MNSEKESLIYLYCLTNPTGIGLSVHYKEGPNKIPELSLLNSGTYFIPYSGLYAVLSKVSTDEFSEENLRKNLADLEWLKTKVSIHEKVIETVMKNSCLAGRQACVIPFKFGTIFNTEENLKVMLKEHISEFKDALKYLEGKEEWGVKIYCNLTELKENFIYENKELLSLNNEIDSASCGKAYILKKKKEDLVKRVVNKKLNEYGQYSFERLKQCAIGSRVNKLLPKEVTERKDDMILNSVFLIYKDKVSDFMDILNALKELFENKGIFFDCTGPWPPYNFCLQEKAKNG